MDCSARDRRRTADRAAETEARAERAASDRARREALRLANGGTSAPGGGGGGGGGISGSTGDAERQVGAVDAGADGYPLVFPAPMARLRAPRSLDDRDRRRAVSAKRRLARYSRLEAARLAVGGTSASGAGGGGTEALGSAMNLDVYVAAVSAMLFLQTS